MRNDDVSDGVRNTFRTHRTRKTTIPQPQFIAVVPDGGERCAYFLRRANEVPIRFTLASGRVSSDTATTTTTFFFATTATTTATAKTATTTATMSRAETDVTSSTSSGSVLDEYDDDDDDDAR